MTRITFATLHYNSFSLNLTFYQQIGTSRQIKFHSIHGTDQHTHTHNHSISTHFHCAASIRMITFQSHDGTEILKKNLNNDHNHSSFYLFNLAEKS